MAANWDVKHHDFQTENFHGVLKGHTGWVTQVVTHPQFPDRLVSSSRDKSLIVWRLQQETGFGTEEPETNILGTPLKSLHGHSHIVSDVTLSADGNYALSGSWDKTLRLWDLKQAQSTRTFHGHTNSVLSVTISPDNRLIGSGSRDKTIKLWNTLGECKYTKGPGEEGAHDDWVSCVRFSPNTNALMLVSAGWDHKIKVWNMQGMFQFAASGKGPNGHVNAITISPDGSLCGSGGKDGNPDLWDLNECKELQTLGYDPKDEFAKRQDKEPINALTFSPTRYWLATAVGSGVKIWELEHKQLQYEISIKDGGHEGKSNKALDVLCLSLAWSSDGNRLFAGFSDNTIRVWNVPGSSSGHDIF